MHFSRSRFKLLAVAASCVALGVGISAIASAGAATGSQAVRAHGRLAARYDGLLRRAVSGQFVVKTRSGFADVSFARGAVVSVSGQQLTLTEGTRRASYKTVTLTIPATAKVRDNRQPASLAQLTAGQRVIVLTLPMRTVVIAHTPKTP